VIGNGESSELTGGPLVGETSDLVRSPLVLAMWAELAEASRWRAEPPSWSTVFEAVRDPARWKEITGGKPEIPPLMLGHTDPERSNSGLLTLILMVESASAAPRSFEGGLTRPAVRDPAVAEAIKAIEAHVVQPLNSSTGFLANSMLEKGAAGMGAALMYESLVIEKNRAGAGTRLVAVYPKEGVFGNEHPIGVVRRPWVTDAHAEAARQYIAYLQGRPQQEKAKAHGFRPIDRTIPVADLLRPELGVSDGEASPLAYPNSQLIREIRAVWRANRPAQP
jgi:ABC-type Fe3+ transport system substrate-binding protein